MKPTVINHELRTIHFQYNSDKPLSDFETRAVLEYVKMHNTLSDLQKRHSKINGTLFQLDSNLKAVEEELNLLEEAVRKCGPLAGYTNEECEKMGITEGSIDVNTVIEKAICHQKKMDICFEETHKFRAEMKTWEANSDKFADEVDAYDKNYFSPIIQNYKEMEIYSCSLDEDMQGFYQIYDDLFLNTKKQFVKTWNEYGKRFNIYLEKVREVFNRTDKMGQKANELINKKKMGGFGIN